MSDKSDAERISNVEIVSIRADITEESVKIVPVIAGFCFGTVAYLLITRK